MQNLNRADDLRIVELRELAAPAELVAQHPITAAALDLVCDTRAAIARILAGTDDRLLVIVGPCSIHDPAAALEYAERLHAVRGRLADRLEIVMRVYFEKPRTTVGWKGLINDPYMDDSFEINDGLRIARQLLNDINRLGVPTGTEFLDTITPQYIADLIAWGAIGARTTESQIHRQLASGLSCPVGFKNGTGGNVAIAIDAVQAARSSHHFLSVTKSGRSAVVGTAGNGDCHVVLRGGAEPNYDRAGVDLTCRKLEAAGLPARLMIDASHGNSRKQHENQLTVCEDLAARIAEGDARVCGVMIESNLIAGRQDHAPGRALTYGQSVTDACLGWEDSVVLLEGLAVGVAARRYALCS